MCFIVVITFQALTAAGSDTCMVGFYLLIHSNIFLSSFWTVLLVKYKLKALLFWVLINQAMSLFASFACTLAIGFSFSPNMFINSDVKNSSEDNKINKPLWPLLIPLEKGNKGSGDEAGRKGEENMKASRKFFLWCRCIFQFGGDIYSVCAYQTNY